jgi:hypothetical protein
MTPGGALYSAGVGTVRRLSFMFDRFSTSFALARSSWQVLRSEKQLILFPILSGLGCLLVVASFAVPLLALQPWGQFQNADGDFRAPPWFYVVAFAFYFCNYFVIVFCNAALISCALLRFAGHKPTLAAGFQAAFSRLPQIMAWALVSATVGLALQAIENANDKAGRFVSWLLGTAWTVITYFVVPVLVVEKVGPFQAIRRSVEILRKTWGKALVGRMGLGFYLFLLFLPGLALFIAGGLLCLNHAALGLAVLFLGLVYGLVWMAVGSALTVIFQSALYQYAAFGEVPSGFDATDMQQAFQSKS